MNNPQVAAEFVAQAFDTIHREQMAGIPILNDRIQVQALGFQEYEGRMLGVVITPWLMTLIMLPSVEDDWDAMALCEKQSHPFPSNSYTFMVNEFNGIGRCQTYSLYSPMGEFANHEHAEAAAEAFLATLMVETESEDVDVVDEELLGKIMRGEELPTELALVDITDEEEAAPVKCQAEAMGHKTISRQDLLRGRFFASG